MSDNDSAALRSTAVPFSSAEIREFEDRFAEYDYDLLDFDRDVKWPGEPSYDP